jgi:competence protein ComEA
MQGQQIVVFVSGAVQNPGVYKLNPGERIGDAVNLAGGIREDGADDYVNLAAQVKDGQQIKIPTIEEARNLIARGEGDGFGVGTGDGTDTANAGAAAGGVNDSMATGTSRNIPAVNAKVNINTANASSLQTLNGIGPATAQKIIEYRNTHGAFTSIEALKQVSGIGEKKFAAIADMICV